MNGGYPFAPPHRQGRAPWQASSPSPAGVNGHGLACGPRQSPGFGPPICRLRQSALEVVSPRAIPLGRLYPVVVGFARFGTKQTFWNASDAASQSLATVGADEPPDECAYRLVLAVRFACIVIITCYQT